MKRYQKSSAAIVLAALVVLAGPVRALAQNAGQSPDKFAPDQKLPIDTKITAGELKNGLRYWIRENKEPKNRAELRLVVRAGSVLEDDNQRGLAHVVEHMAFNGSKHFARQALVDFMESIGMRFGPDLNAFTGFDETVFMLKIPMDSPEILRKALLILEDWAHGLSFDDQAIDKERGIIIEEWRLGQGADSRMRAQQFPILFRGSRYAERLPIGTKDSIEHFDHDALRRFYASWYRPDLMAVIAVGDFDRARMEDLIRRQFDGIPRTSGPPRPAVAVPEHDEMLFAIATDKEETESTVAVYHKLPVVDQDTVGAYRQMLVERLFNVMLSERFAEIAQKPNSPFLGAVSSKGRLVEARDVYVLSALVPEGGVARGLQALATEGERVARFGFTPTELERQKSEMMRTFERAFTERETENSSSYAEEFTRSFLQGEPTPGIEFEYEAHKRFLPGISLDEINRLAREWMTGPNRVVMVNAPDKAGVPVPDAKELTAILDSVKAADVSAYKDATSDKPLLGELPTPGQVVASKTRPEVGITEWMLSNGVRVVLKPTAYKEDEIQVRAISPGGVSLAAEDNLIPANTADEVVTAGGLDGFSAIDLEKKLAGKAAFVRPLIGELEEGLSGNASPKDVELLFQLIYLTFTQPRPDPAIFEVLKTQLKSFLENRSRSPEAVFTDTLRSTMQRDTPRFRPMTVEEIPKMDLQKSLAFYRDRFADASDFTFIFVGNLDLDKIKPLACRYLASLPSLHRTETWKDWRIPPPAGVVRRSVTKGVEPKSLTALVFSGPIKDTLENRNAIGAACQVLETRLRKLLRETLSGTYDVSVAPTTSKIPREEYRVSINLGADPKRIDDLSEAIFREIKRLQTKGPDEKEVQEVRTADSRDYETYSRQNGWWLAELTERYRLGESPAEALRIPGSFRLLTKGLVKKAARTYFNTENYVQVTLYPEKKSAEPAPRERATIASSLLAPGAQAASTAVRDYPISPVPFTQVKVADAFWLPRMETNRTATLPFLFQKNEETGRLDNFAVAGGLIKGRYKGERYNDTDVYKPIEGASYSLMVHPDPELDRDLDAMIAKIAAAQEPDGYLFTARTCDPIHPQPGIGAERWVEETVSHELYNAGHLYEAAVAHFLATGKRTLLGVAIKNADLVASVFGPDKRHGFPGHQEIELALVKLYRVTKNAKYLALAKYFLDQRGHDVKLTQYPPGNRFAIYNQPEQIQAHKPVLEQDEAVGHAVRLTYMASGMADVAAISGDPAYLKASEQLWANVVGKKMYLTAGVGSRHDRERFGENYELPNLTGYLETCASIGMAYWNERMFLLTGDARYVDVLERAMYNGILSGVSLDGRAFFYANPLESDGKFRFNQGGLGRAPFFGTACCPGNLSRFLPSIPGYVYAVKDDALFVNLFIEGEASVEVGGGKVAVRQQTRYPWDGAVQIAVEPAGRAPFAVLVRIPGWARDEAVPGNLYRFLNTDRAKPELKVNGQAVPVVLEKGYARINRTWEKGDRIELVLPMPVRRVVADEAVRDDRGKVALVRGPLVYCAEWPDNGGRVLNSSLPDGQSFRTEWRPDVLGGIVVIQANAAPAAQSSAPRPAGEELRKLVLIPYYAWAHRGPGEMAVWLPRI